MQAIENIQENLIIEHLVRAFPRSILQKNRLHESDAELIAIPGTSSLLAATMDSIVEEIETGLYTDPFLMGWMVVMANMSDLAAVGADPIGLLINETLRTDLNQEFIEKIQSGIRVASEKCFAGVLGGDTNYSDKMELSACALGMIPNGQAMTRKGCRDGDILFSSSFLGDGNAYAYKNLCTQDKSNRIIYLPEARIREGKILKNYASSCMDTSDGFLATLDQLMRLNQVGFLIDEKARAIINQQALALCKRNDLPIWSMLAGPHGEFELLFTVPEYYYRQFLNQAASIGWYPLKLGHVVDEIDIIYQVNCGSFIIDTEHIRNLYSHYQDNLRKYIAELIKETAKWPEE